MDRLNALRAKRGKITDDWDLLLDTATKETRDLNEAEKRAAQDYEKMLGEIDESILLEEKLAASKAKNATPIKDGEGDGTGAKPKVDRNPWYAEADKILGRGIDAERVIDGLQKHGGEYADKASATLDPVSVTKANLRARLRRCTALGMMLSAVARSNSNWTDPRLTKAASGASEMIPSDGGFLVNEDMASDLQARIATGSEIISRVDGLPLSSGSNRVKVNVVAETSRANGSRWGGVTAFWAAEADTVTATKPKIEQVALELNKLFGLMYATDELLADTTLLGALAETAFSEELRFKAEDAIFRGTGVGQPLGILSAPCTVSQAIEATQTIANSNTFIATNTAKMLSRMPARNKRSAVWLIQTELLPTFMNATAGATAGTPPIWMTGQNFENGPQNRVWGYPVVETEYNEAVGTVGDIVLADLSQYATIDGGGIQAAQSMHVRFINDEMTFRWTWRLDGQPKWRSPITPFKGALTRSPFITLAVRS